MVEETNFFHFEPSGSQAMQIKNLQMESDLDISSLEPVVVIDSGIDFSRTPLLEKFVIDRWIADGITDVNKSHGTQVASRVILRRHIGATNSDGTFDSSCNSN
jgi:hypothetical protein